MAKRRMKAVAKRQASYRLRGKQPTKKPKEIATKAVAKQLTKKPKEIAIKEEIAMEQIATTKQMVVQRILDAAAKKKLEKAKCRVKSSCSGIGKPKPMRNLEPKPHVMSVSEVNPLLFVATPVKVEEDDLTAPRVRSIAVQTLATPPRVNRVQVASNPTGCKKRLTHCLCFEQEKGKAPWKERCGTPEGGICLECWKIQMRSKCTAAHLWRPMRAQTLAMRSLTPPPQ